MANLLFLIASDKHTGPGVMALQHATLLRDAGHAVFFSCWPGGTLAEKSAAARLAAGPALTLATRATSAIRFPLDLVRLRQFSRQKTIDVSFCYRTADHLVAACSGLPVLRFLHHALIDTPGGWLRRHGLQTLLCAKPTRAILTTDDDEAIRMFYVRQPEALHRPPAASRDELLELAARSGVAPVPCAIDTDVFSPERRGNSRRDELGFSPEDCVIGFVSRMKWGRGHYRFLDAFARAAAVQGNLRALLVGDGEESEKILPYAEKLGVMKKLVWVKDAGGRFVETVAAADMGFLFSPGSAGTARAALEMMGLGLPVVCPRGGVFNMIRSFEGNATALPVTATAFAEDCVEPDSRNQVWADAFVRLAQNPEERRIMGQTARRMVLARFSQAAATARLERLLRQVLPVPSNPAREIADTP